MRIRTVCCILVFSLLCSLSLPVSAGREETAGRAELLLGLWMLVGAPMPEAAAPFSDIPADAPYAQAVAWAYENGIAAGVGDGRFAPAGTLTRQQALTFLYRCSLWRGGAEYAESALPRVYPDAAEVAPWARASFLWAADAGLLSGSDGGLLAPNEPLPLGRLDHLLEQAAACLAPPPSPEPHFSELTPPEYSFRRAETLFTALLAALEQSAARLALPIYQELSDTYACAKDAALLLRVDYSLSPAPERLARWKQAEADAAALYGLLGRAIAAALASGCEKSFIRYVQAAPSVLAYREYEAPGAEELALEAELAALEAQYAALSAGYETLYTLETEDGLMTLAALRAGAEQYEQEIAACMDTVYRAAYALLQREAALRNQIAALHGCADYYEYLWEARYGRDYAYGDFLAVAGYAAALRVPLPARDDPAPEAAGPAFLTELRDGGLLSPLAGEAAAHIERRGLAVFGGAGALDQAFSGLLYGCDAPLLYAGSAAAGADAALLLHEFGHAANSYLRRGQSPLEDLRLRVEVAETQALGMQLLCCGASRQAENLRYVLDCLRLQAVYAQLEALLYKQPELDYDAALEAARRLFEGFGLEAPSGNAWVLLPHLSEEPGYLCAYPMAAAAALGLWLRYPAYPADTLQDLDALLALGNSGYLDMLERFGLLHVLEADFYKELEAALAIALG